MTLPAGGAASFGQRHLTAICSTALLGVFLLSLICFDGLGQGVRSVFEAVPLLSSQPQLQDRRPTSALIQPPTAARCNRLHLPAALANSTAVPYYPAAVRDPVTGEWYLFFTYQEELKGACNVKGGCETGRHQGGRSRSHPLLLRLGYGALPDMRLAQTDVQKLQLHESFAKLKQQHGASALKASEWRPFSWKGQIYLSHWLALPPGQERAALARLDLEHGSLEHVYRFEVLQEELAKYHGRRTRTHDRSTSGLEQRVDTEASWGFVPEKDGLVIYPSLLPCTVALEFDAEVPEGALLRNRHCYEDQAGRIEDYTGLDILKHEMLSSGNPVAWDIERGGRSRELIAVMHKRGHDTEHWAVRIDRASHRISHISAGPILTMRDFQPEGFLEAEIVVSTYHVIDMGEPWGRILRVVYGEGDHLFCWVDITTEAIVWHALPAPRTLPKQTRMRFKASGTIS